VFPLVDTSSASCHESPLHHHSSDAPALSASLRCLPRSSSLRLGCIHAQCTDPFIALIALRSLSPTLELPHCFTVDPSSSQSIKNIHSHRQKSHATAILRDTLLFRPSSPRPLASSFNIRRSTPNPHSMPSHSFSPVVLSLFTRLVVSSSMANITTTALPLMPDSVPACSTTFKLVPSSASSSLTQPHAQQRQHPYEVSNVPSNQSSC
jgi:hypothetical protein